MATKLLVTGQAVDFPPADGKSFTLEEMQKAVAGGGSIEAIYHPNGEMLVFDEEGKLKDLLPNSRATEFAMECGIAKDDYIAGAALRMTIKEFGD